MSEHGHYNLSKSETTSFTGKADHPSSTSSTISAAINSSLREGWGESLILSKSLSWTDPTSPSTRKQRSGCLGNTSSRAEESFSTESSTPSQKRLPSNDDLNSLEKLAETDRRSEGDLCLWSGFSQRSKNSKPTAIDHPHATLRSEKTFGYALDNEQRSSIASVDEIDLEQLFDMVQKKWHWFSIEFKAKYKDIVFKGGSVTFDLIKEMILADTTGTLVKLVAERNSDEIQTNEFFSDSSSLSGHLETCSFVKTIDKLEPRHESQKSMKLSYYRGSIGSDLSRKKSVYLASCLKSISKEQIDSERSTDSPLSKTSDNFSESISSLKSLAPSVNSYSTATLVPSSISETEIGSSANAMSSQILLQSAKSFLPSTISFSSELGTSSISSLGYSSIDELLINLGLHELGSKRCTTTQESSAPIATITNSLVKNKDMPEIQTAFWPSKLNERNGLNYRPQLSTISSVATQTSSLDGKSLISLSRTTSDSIVENGSAYTSSRLERKSSSALLEELVNHSQVNCKPKILKLTNLHEADAKAASMPKDSSDNRQSAECSGDRTRTTELGCIEMRLPVPETSPILTVQTLDTDDVQPDFGTTGSSGQSYSEREVPFPSVYSFKMYDFAQPVQLSEKPSIRCSSKDKISHDACVRMVGRTLNTGVVQGMSKLCTVAFENSDFNKGMSDTDQPQHQTNAKKGSSQFYSTATSGLSDSDYLDELLHLGNHVELTKLNEKFEQKKQITLDAEENNIKCSCTKNNSIEANGDSAMPTPCKITGRHVSQSKDFQGQNVLGIGAGQCADFQRWPYQESHKPREWHGQQPMLCSNMVRMTSVPQLALLTANSELRGKISQATGSSCMSKPKIVVKMTTTSKLRAKAIKGKYPWLQAFTDKQ